MKKLLIVLLALMLCTAMFVACDGNGDEGTATTTTEQPADPTPPAPTQQVIVEANKTTKYTVITQKSMSSDALSLVRSFIGAVQQKTGVRLGQLNESSAPESDYEITVNVTRSRPDAADLYERTAYTNYRIERSGNRIMIVAFSSDILEDALTALLGQLTKDADGAWSIPANYKANQFGMPKTSAEISAMEPEEMVAYYSYLPEIDKIPKYETLSGSIQPIHSLGYDGYAIAIKNTTKAEYDAYVQKILGKGFATHASNTISAGTGVTEQNTYHFFTLEKIHLYTHYQPNLKVARIYFMPPAALPSTTPETLTATDTVPVTVAQIQLDYATAGGMSYVYQLADGRFVVIDGGIFSARNRDIMMNYLQTKATAAGMQKPVIAMWLISHPHQDHYGLLKDGFMDYAANQGVVIESFAFNLANQRMKNLSDGVWADANTFRAMIRELYPNATVYTPHAGQVFYFKGLTMEILQTEEELYPFNHEMSFIEQNHLCINWRVTLDNGKTFMFLADNSAPNNEQLAKIYREELKSDVMQVAHHGLSGAELTCYQYIDPDICLWPSPYERFMGIYKGTLFGNKLAQDQWGLGFRYKLNSSGQPVDDKGNVVTDPALAAKTVLSAPNVWLLDESIKKRYDYHNSETVEVREDLSINIIRYSDSAHKFTLPTLPTNHSDMDYKSGVIPFN